MEDGNVQKPRGEMICERKYEKLLFDLRLQTYIEECSLVYTETLLCLNLQQDASKRWGKRC